MAVRRSVVRSMVGVPRLGPRPSAGGCTEGRGGLVGCWSPYGVVSVRRWCGGCRPVRRRWRRRAGCWRRRCVAVGVVGGAGLDGGGLACGGGLEGWLVGTLHRGPALFDRFRVGPPRPIWSGNSWAGALCISSAGLLVTTVGLPYSDRKRPTERKGRNERRGAAPRGGRP